MTIAQRLADAGIEVKPLEWVGDKKDHAAGLGYIYMLVHDFDGWRWFRCIGRELNGVSDGVFPAIEAAKSAAQADYTTRILSALQEVKPWPRQKSTRSSRDTSRR